jgi:cytoskeletal protein CcmA (bactofilin family)
MRKILLLISCLAFSSAVLAADNPCESNSGPYGPMTCTDGSVPSLSANGPLTVSGTIVQQGTEVNGSLTANKATFHDVTVNGDVSLNQSTVKGAVVVNGVLTAIKTTFAELVTLSTNASSFNDSQTKSILVQNSGDGVVSPQTITLSGNTIVTGDITFSGQDGLVNVGPNAKITGRVVGGKMVQAKATPTAAPKKTAR